MVTAGGQDERPYLLDLQLATNKLAIELAGLLYGLRQFGCLDMMQADGIACAEREGIAEHSKSSHVVSPNAAWVKAFAPVTVFDLGTVFGIRGPTRAPTFRSRRPYTVSGRLDQ